MNMSKLFTSRWENGTQYQELTDTVRCLDCGIEFRNINDEAVDMAAGLEKVCQCDS